MEKIYIKTSKSKKGLILTINGEKFIANKDSLENRGYAYFGKPLKSSNDYFEKLINKTRPEQQEMVA